MTRALPESKRKSRNRAGEAGWVSTSFSKKLSGRRSKGTIPEIALRSALHKKGIRFRLHPDLGDRLTGDFLIFPNKICVFVDGCFWHQCGKHKPPPSRGANAVRWAAKFARTRTRDRNASQHAAQMGYIPLRIWECEVKAGVEAVVDRILALLK